MNTTAQERADALAKAEKARTKYHEQNENYDVWEERVNSFQRAMSPDFTKRLLEDFAAMEEENEMLRAALEDIAGFGEAWGEEDEVVEDIGGYDRSEPVGVNVCLIAKAALDKAGDADA